MGYERVEIKITARLSRHNTDWDKKDNKLWEELCAEIKDLTYSSRYARICSEVEYK